MGVLRRRHDRDREHEQQDDEGHVDEEDRAPPEVLEQQAGGDRAERTTDAGERRPDRDRLRALVEREAVHDDREGRRHDERGADAHHGAGGDELARVVGLAGDEAGEAEHDEAELQRALATEPVAEGAGREQHAGEDQGVGVEDPLQLGAGRPRLCWMLGMATFSELTATTIITRLMHSVPRISHRRW